MTATLSITPLPAYGPRARRAVADCRHGTTTAVVLAGSGPDAVDLTDRELAAIVTAKLLSEEGCRCARRLAKRYGVGVTP